jgi:P-type Ca2+ transporter type 2C
MATRGRPEAAVDRHARHRRLHAPPWAQDATDVAAALGTDLATGLTADEAARRLERFGRNQLDATPPVPAWRKLLAQLADPLVYLLGGAVVISLVAWLIEGREGVPFEVIVITAIVLANAVLGYVQEARAEEAVAALQRMAAAMSSVVRDGREQRIPADDLVPGDVLLLAEGDSPSAPTSAWSRRRRC